MYCNQCEQTAQGIACTKQGVCGKTSEIAAIQDMIVYAARGLALAALAAGKKGVATNAAGKLCVAALFSTGSIGCQPVGTAKDEATFVVCAAQVGSATIDVGTALISSGAAFAATFPSGAPVSAAYAVAETTARENGSGLWAGRFTHPVSALLGEQ